MQTEERISGSLEQMPISTLLETDARSHDRTSVDPISGEPMVDVIDDGERLTVTRGWQTIVDARTSGRASVPARITRVDRVYHPVPRMLELKAIITDPRLQPRVAMHENLIAEYAERMREGAQFPAVDVVRDDEGFYWLAAGWHRYYAAERAGFDEIAANVHDGTLEDAILIAAPSNGKHGKPMSNDDKKRAVRMILEHPRAIREAWSDQRIADAAGVSRATVHNYRSDMERKGLRPVMDVRQGGDGKLYAIKNGPVHPADAPEPPLNGHRSHENGTEPVEPTTEPSSQNGEPEPVELFECGEDGCGQAFAVPSWHCRRCNQHWPASRYISCPSCHAEQQGSDVVITPQPSMPVVSVVDVPMPKPERPSEPQAKYEPATFKPEAVIGAYGMVNTGIEMITQYSHYQPADIAAVPTDDVKRERLNYLSAAIDWLVEIEKRWKSDLGIETVPEDAS